LTKVVKTFGHFSIKILLGIFAVVKIIEETLRIAMYCLNTGNIIYSIDIGIYHDVSHALFIYL